MAAFAEWKFFQFWPTKGQKISWQYSSVKICKRNIFFQCNQVRKAKEGKTLYFKRKNVKNHINDCDVPKSKEKQVPSNEFYYKSEWETVFFVSDSYLFICILWCKTLDTKGPTVSHWCFYHVFMYTLGKDFLRWQQWQLCLRK